MKTQKRLLGVLVTGCLAGALALSAQAKGYTPVNLVSDIPGVARHTDPLLLNAWGLAVTPSGRVWISDNGTGVSTVYKRNGKPLRLVVTVPAVSGTPGDGTPTGVAANSTTNFAVTLNATSAPSLFLFATEDGTISGWNPAVDASNAVVAVDNSGSGAVYKGIALGQNGGSNFVYVANFSAGVVDMYDADFGFVRSFTDPDPAIQDNGFAPFNVQTIAGQLYVTFARKNPGTPDDVAGAGNGYVDVFATDGALVKRLVSQGELNSPWGMALAPAGFGKFSNALLVGNFGDGRIGAYDAATGAFLGQLEYRDGKPIEIDGLWALAFAPPKPNNPNDAEDDAITADAKKAVLYFTAGIVDEGHGLFGFIRRSSSEDFK